MIIRPKDTVKLFGIVIMCACAVLICTLFLNSNIDLARIKDQITHPQTEILYDLTISSGKMTSAVTGGALALTTIVMLIFYIKHYIDAHRPELGILKALGYSNLTIAKGFWVFGLSVFTGTVIGFGGAFAFMPAFYKEQRNDGLLPEISVHFNPLLLIYLVVLPTLFFSILAILYSYRKLQCPTLDLIRGNVEVKPRKVNLDSKRKRDVTFLHDLKQSTVKSKISLAFFIWFAAFCYAATVVMSFSVGEVGASDMMAAMMAGIGIVLAVTTLFLAVTTVIKGNAKTISMLRVFGYSNREIGGAILSGYRPITYVGFAMGTVYQHGLMKMMMALFFDSSVLDLPEYNFHVRAAVIGLVSFVVLYEVFMFAYAKRIRRISLKEVMQGE